MRMKHSRDLRNAGCLLAGAAVLTAASLQAPSLVEAATAASSGNMCSNPTLSQNLNGWGVLDNGVVSRDTVGDLAGTSWAFDTSGRRLYQPQLSVSGGQHWVFSAMDRVLNGSGTARIAVDWYTANGGYLGQTTADPVTIPLSTLQNGAPWTPVIGSFTVPDGVTTAHILQFADFGSSTGTAFKVTECDYELQSTQPTPDPSGIAMPVGDLAADSQGPQGWHQVFSDDFTTDGNATQSGSLPDGKWWGYTAGTKITNSTNGIYDSSRTVSVSGGQTVFNLHSEGGMAYAAVESPMTANQVYGRYDIRYRYEPGSNLAGYKSVWMLWPNDNHWGEGEIDFAEYDNAADRQSVSANLHHACGNDSGCAQDSGQAALDPTAWHTATTIWSPGRVTALVDGVVIAASTIQVPSTPMHLLLQTEASDYGPQAAPSTVVKIDVDWVVQYTRN